MSVRYVDKIPNNNIFKTLLTEYFVVPTPGTDAGYNVITGENTIPKFNKDPPSNHLVNWYGPIWYWDTSLVTDMNKAFKGIQKRGLFSPPPLIPGVPSSTGTHAPSNGIGYGLLWNTSSVLNMESMFEDFDAPGLNSSGADEVHRISFLQNVATSSNGSYIPTSVRGPPSLSPYLSPVVNKYIEDDYDVWDTSNVTNMKNMFKNCLLKVFKLPFYQVGSPTIVMNNWNTSSVTTMESMFDGCDAGWGNGTDPQKDCLPWEIIRKNGSNSYYNSWVTYKCMNFKKMFANISLTNVTYPLKQHLLKKYNHKKPIKGGWMIEEKISDLTDMFYSSPKLIALFELTNAQPTPLYWQFNYVDPITISIKTPIEDYYTTDISLATTSGAPGSPGFQPNEGINTKPEYSDITNTPYYGQIWDWDTSQVSDFSEAFVTAFSNAYNYYPIYSTPFDNEADKWYFGTGPTQTDNNLTQTNSFNKPIWIDKWDTSSVTTMNSMFHYLNEQGSSKKMVFLSSSLETKYINDNDPNTTGVLYRPPYIAWNTSSVTSMINTFKFVPYTFISPTNLPNVKNWNTSSVENMYGMYSENGYGASGSPSVQQLLGLKSLDLSKKPINKLGNASPYVAWDTSLVANMEKMFYRSHKIQSQSNLTFKIGNWNTSSVNTMESMFNTNKDFNEDISKWDTSSVTTMKSMFESATSFDQDIGQIGILQV